MKGMPSTGDMMKAGKGLTAARLLRWGVPAVCLLLLAACSVSYKFNGASIDYNKVHTIQIADFPIRSTYVWGPMGPMFNNQLKDVFATHTRLQPAGRVPVEDDDVVPVLGADDAQRLGDLLVVDAQVAHVVRGGEPDAGAPTGPQVQCVELEAGVEVGLRQVGLEEVVAAAVQVEDRARVPGPAGPAGRLTLEDEHGGGGAGRLRG